MRFIFVMSISILGYFPGTSQTYIGNQKEIDKILKKIERFSEYVMQSDFEKIGESYTLDGKIFPDNRQIIAGRESITDYWKLPDGVKTNFHKITPEEIKILGDEAYDYGYYEGKTKRASGEEVSWQGKYVIVWRKVNRAWQIYLDIWNRVEN